MNEDFNKIKDVYSLCVKMVEMVESKEYRGLNKEWNDNFYVRIDDFGGLSEIAGVFLYSLCFDLGEKMREYIEKYDFEIEEGLGWEEDFYNIYIEGEKKEYIGKNEEEKLFLEILKLNEKRFFGVNGLNDSFWSKEERRDLGNI